MVVEIGNALTNVLSWIGQAIGSIIDTDGALHSLLPVVSIAIGIALVMVSIKILRRICWGA